MYFIRNFALANQRRVPLYERRSLFASCEALHLKTMASKGILIKNGIVVADGCCNVMDVLVKENVIERIGVDIPNENFEVIDAQGCLVSYGLADVHVHFREPGFSAKETIRTGSMAAAHGGYTTVCTMPNLSPAPDAPDTLAVEQGLIAEQAVIDVRPYATITKERKGQEIVDVEALCGSVAGFSDDGSGVQNEDVMRQAMEKVALSDGIIAAHEEDNALLHNGYIHDGEYAKAHNHRGICSESEWGPIARDVELAEQTGCRFHVCHISTKESVDIIRKAKQRGVKVTCETAPHYLVLCDEDMQEEGRFKMNPPLRSREDKEALLAGIVDGTIDCIATDHAPHTAEEKGRGLEKSAMGIVGLETAFPIIYTHLVRRGVITLERLVELMCGNPRKLFRLGGRMAEGEKADIAIFNLKTPFTIRPEAFLSKGKSTPFEGWDVYGECIMTIYNGEIVWKK